jgi:hypothetical protein
LVKKMATKERRKIDALENKLVKILDEMENIVYEKEERTFMDLGKSKFRDARLRLAEAIGDLDV